MTVLDLFDGRESLRPLWEQVQGFREAVAPIMAKAPQGVHFICYSQGRCPWLNSSALSAAGSLSEGHFLCPFLNRIAPTRALVPEPSFSDFPQHLGLTSVCVLNGREAPCTNAPSFPITRGFWT